MIRIHVCLLQLITIVSMVLGHTALSLAANKSEIVQKWVEAKAENMELLERIDIQISDNYQQTSTANLGQISDQIEHAADRFKNFENAIDNLRTQKHEYVLRQYFYDRMLFFTQQDYQPKQPLLAFYIKTIDHMAKIEMKEIENPSYLWRFLAYLKMHLIQLPEKSEDVVDFIIGYVKTSGVLNHMHQQLLQHDYSNGKEGVRANDVSKESVGDDLPEALPPLSSPTPLPDLTDKTKKEQKPSPLFRLHSDVLKETTPTNSASTKDAYAPEVGTFQSKDTPATEQQNAPLAEQLGLQLKNKIQQATLSKFSPGTKPDEIKPEFRNGQEDEFKVRLIPAQQGK